MQHQIQQQDETVAPTSLWGVPAEVSVAKAETSTEKTDTPAESFESRPLTRAEVDTTNPLIYRLKRKSSVRNLAIAALRGETITTISPLLEALENPSRNGWKLQQVAAWTLGRAKLDANQQAVAAATLSRVLAGGTTYDGGRVGRAVIRTLLPALIISLPLTAFFWQAEWPLMLPMLLSMVIFIGAFCSPATLTISFSTDDEKTNRVRAAAAEALGNLGRPETVEALLTAHLNGSKKVRAAATSALHKVLPTLTSDHYGQLDTSVVPNLCRALTHWEATFVLEVVEALGKVGDGRAVAALMRLEQSERRSEVRTEIAAILPTLLERRRREEESGMLLRGSEVPLEPETLLRPSLPQNSEDSRQSLLRATQGDKEG